MSEKCEKTGKCGFFINFKENPTVVEKGWVQEFCNDLKNSENCVRKQLKKKSDKPLPDNMTPTGEML